MSGQIRIGISGWTYPPWRGGNFYPETWPQKRELEYASRKLASIEINGTFYSLQRPSSYRAWYDATPQGFVFSVKGPRFVTHIKRLHDVTAPLANFFGSGVLLLGEKLGPFLWQLPPSFPFHRERLKSFFKQLPRDTKAAIALARKHGDRRKEREWAPTGKSRPLRHAIEIRHPSFVTPDFIGLLRDNQIALVIADTAGKWPAMEDLTADFVYVRLHGDEALYVSGYTPAALAKWATKIRTWSRGAISATSRQIAPRLPARTKGREVFVYFDNDVKVRSPFDAMTLAHSLKLGAPPGDPPGKAALKPFVPRKRWPAIKGKS